MLLLQLGISAILSLSQRGKYPTSYTVSRSFWIFCGHISLGIISLRSGKNLSSPKCSVEVTVEVWSTWDASAHPAMEGSFHWSEGEKIFLRNCIRQFNAGFVWLVNQLQAAWDRRKTKPDKWHRVNDRGPGDIHSRQELAWSPTGRSRMCFNREGCLFPPSMKKCSEELNWGLGEGNEMLSPVLPEEPFHLLAKHLSKFLVSSKLPSLMASQ